MAARGRFDVIGDYALALPTAVISFMLGIPEEHRHRLHNFSTLILGALDPVVSQAKMQAGHDAVEEFGAMLEEPAIAAELGAAGRRFMRDEFSVGTMVDRHLGVYGEVLDA